MKYYRVRLTHDNSKVINNKGRIITELIGNELYTPAEYKRLSEYVPHHYFDEVDISRTRTYKSFGARFEIGTSYPTDLEYPDFE